MIGHITREVAKKKKNHTAISGNWLCLLEPQLTISAKNFKPSHNFHTCWDAKTIRPTIPVPSLHIHCNVAAVALAVASPTPTPLSTARVDNVPVIVLHNAYNSPQSSHFT